jgi:hypothetical protein
MIEIIVAVVVVVVVLILMCAVLVSEVVVVGRRIGSSSGGGRSNNRISSIRSGKSNIVIGISGSRRSVSGANGNNIGRCCRGGEVRPSPHKSTNEARTPTPSTPGRSGWH